MLFTGLNDIFGEEVYEGDVLEISRGHVKIDRYYTVGDLREFYFLVHDSDPYMRITSYEVVGNRFENPELLEGR